MANSAEPRHPGEGFIPAEHVGTLLQENRLRLGQDLRIVADDLRIKYHHLLAIEDGRFDDLPGPTYVTGFIRAYAEHLGLDAEEIVRRYKNEPQGTGGAGSLDFPASSGGGGMPAGALLLILLVVAAASYGVWYWMSVSKTSLADLLPSLPPPLVAMIYGPDEAGGSDAPGGETTESEVASVGTETGDAEDTAVETPEPAAPDTDAPSSDGLAALTPTPETTPEEPAPEDPTPNEVADSAEPPTSAIASDADGTTPEPQPQTETEAEETTAAAQPQTATDTDTETQTDTEAGSNPETGAADAPQATPDGDAPPSSQGSATASAEEAQGGEATDPAEAETETAAETDPGADTQPNTEPGNDPSVPTDDETDTAETGTDPDEEQTASAPPAIPETAADNEAETEAEPEPTLEPEPEPEPEETAEAEEEPEETPPAYVGRAAPSDVRAITGDSRIVLRANRDSWIQVRRAGELVVRRLLRRGDTYAVPGGVGYTLNTSNAGGLEVYIDGRRAPNLGPVGAARNGIILSPSRLN